MNLNVCVIGDLLYNVCCGPYLVLFDVDHSLNVCLVAKVWL